MDIVDWNGLFPALIKVAKSPVSGCYVMIVFQGGYYKMIRYIESLMFG